MDFCLWKAVETVEKSESFPKGVILSEAKSKNLGRIGGAKISPLATLGRDDTSFVAAYGSREVAGGTCLSPWERCPVRTLGGEGVR